MTRTLPRRWLRWWSVRPLFHAVSVLRRTLGEEALRREAARMLELSPAARVLDLGCGLGFHLPQLAENAAEVVAVDTDAERVEAARAQIRDHGWKHVRALLWDGEKLPFETGSFDAVLCASSLSTTADYRRLLDEGVRVLQPGGRLAAVDFLPPEGIWSYLGWLVWPYYLLAGADPNRPLSEELDRRLPLFAHQVRLGGLMFVAAGRKPGDEKSEVPAVREPESELVPAGV